MNNFLPRGRNSVPTELLQFGVHLVYSEGTRTEPYYVDNIKNRIAEKYKCKPNDIDIIRRNGEKSLHTVDLVNFAITDVKQKLRKGRQINHVWIFFDKDSFDDFNAAHNLILAQNDSTDKNLEDFYYNTQTGIVWHSCWSNECFELWLWLYYDYCESRLTRDDYKDKLNNQPKLKKIGFKYEKNIPNIHDILTQNGGSLNNAIRFAKKLNGSSGTDNPSTGVVDFAEYFKNYMLSN